ncbi:MAG: DUF86 domain-containing protein [Pseudomonadales bacterium]|nr:DUF86 domain-containing protein [Candidatus Woesebacteria bacterium]MCB9802382.1 DUF86 domain-containing protein [Pseudomonadales bacterium]
MSRDNLVYVHHMKEALEKVLAFSSSNTYELLCESEWDQDALARNLEIVGEAAGNTSPVFREKYSQIQWREIILILGMLLCMTMLI